MDRAELEYCRSGWRPGDITRVEHRPHHSPDRPVRIHCEGHAFAYDLAWTDTPDGPELTDLRLVALDPSVRVTKRDLLRINPDRLAGAAKDRAPSDDREFLDRTRQHISEALRAEAERLGLGPVPDDVQVSSYRERGEPLVIQERKPGRPQLSLEIYRRIADTARRAHRDAGTRSIRKYVHEESKKWPDVAPVSLHGVDRWLKKCRELGLLEPGELGGKPKKSRETGQ